jgi:phospholipase D1/2
MSSIRTRVSKLLHLDPLSNVHHEHEDDARSDSASSADSSALSRVPSAMLDPSTTNKVPFRLQQDVSDEHGEDENTTQKKVPNDVSKHTFYVLNSQMRLKISAKNEVMSYPISIKYYLLKLPLTFSVK